MGFGDFVGFGPGPGWPGAGVGAGDAGGGWPFVTKMTTLAPRICFDPPGGLVFATVPGLPPAGTSCGDTGTECINQDTCLAGACHDNGFKSAGTTCGDPSSGECDSADTCNGAGSCQANHTTDGTNCGDTGTECAEIEPVSSSPFHSRPRNGATSFQIRGRLLMS